jgi:rhamnan synthesis protein F
MLGRDPSAYNCRGRRPPGRARALTRERQNKPPPRRAFRAAVRRALRFVVRKCCQFGVAGFSVACYYLFELRRQRSGIGLRLLSGSFEPSGLWCIFAIHQEHAVSQNLVKYLTALKCAGYNVVLVNDGVLGREPVAAFLPLCHTVVSRPKGGRDFGSYKWGTQFLRRADRIGLVNQMVYCNDSIFVRPRAFAAFLDELKQIDDDYIGVVDSRQISYHVQSWLFAVSGRIFKSAPFDDFWKQYKPYSHRTHCIANGEIALTRHLVRAGVVPRVLYPQRAIVDLMLTGPPDTALERLVTLLRPIEYERLAKTIEPLASAGRLCDLKKKFLAALGAANLVGAVNLILVGCSPFPFLKKDLVYRAQYFVSQVEQGVGHWTGDDAEELAEILSYYRARGTLRARYSLAALSARLGVT